MSSKLYNKLLDKLIDYYDIKCYPYTNFLIPYFSEL